LTIWGLADEVALSTMASSRFVDPPDELRACSEAFHAEAMKHLDAVFEEQSYSKSRHLAAEMN